LPRAESNSEDLTGQASPIAGGRPSIWLAAVLLAISLALVYGRALDAPYVFDDHDTIVKNTSIRSLWPLVGTSEHRGPLNPMRDLPTSARPLVNYSFALNYHFGGLSLAGYHVVNVVIHFLSTLLLFAFVRRTLRLPYFGGRFDAAAGGLACVTALLWSLHPLHTEAVIYATQRTELMMALFYLATLYCSLRYWTANPFPLGKGSGNSHRGLWLSLAILACLCGMLSKEVMVSAPIIALLYERTFVSGTFANSLRRSWPLYLGMALTWIPLLVLSADSPRSFSSGFHLCDNIFVYWCTQCKVLLMYLKLAIWPWPLRCAYELPKVDTIVTFVMYVVPVLLMALLALALLKRNHPVGFLLVFMAAVLAPTSIMPILTEMAAERRMYLPLTGLMVLFVVGVYVFAKRQLKLNAIAESSPPDSNRPRVAAFASVAAIALLYGVMSAIRLTHYYNETLMWQQVAETQPLNHIAHYNLGLLYNEAGREAESFTQLQAAVAANPHYPNARSALGFALMNAGHMPEAIESIQAALDMNPEHVGALNNMGIALIRMGKFPEAIEYLERAVRLDPSHADAHNNLGQALRSAGRTAEATEQLEIARSLTPDDADVLNNLATSLANNNQLPQAIELFKRALQLRPDSAAAHNGLGIALHKSGDIPGATEHFQQFQKLRPNEPGAYFNLAIVAEGKGDFEQAARLYEHVTRLRPDAPPAHFSLAKALVQTGKTQDAIEHFQKALELNPNMLPAYAALADALASANRNEEAIQVAQRGIRAAQSVGDEKSAAQIEKWLSDNQSGPRQKQDALPKQPPPK
jgi:protein O-mannosyl-transferase